MQAAFRRSSAHTSTLDTVYYSTRKARQVHMPTVPRSCLVVHRHIMDCATCGRVACIESSRRSRICSEAYVHYGQLLTSTARPSALRPPAPAQSWRGDKRPLNACAHIFLLHPPIPACLPTARSFCISRPPALLIA